VDKKITHHDYKNQCKKPDVKKWFDTSKYSESHPLGIETGINKKVPGMMKDELGDKPMTQFVGLSAKLYSYEISDG